MTYEAQGSGNNGARGGADEGEPRHVPVMLSEVIEALSPGSPDLVIDGTFGAGGYSEEILKSGARVIGIDRDPDAIAEAQPMVDRHGGRLQLVEGPFSRLQEHCNTLGTKEADGVVLDIGVSSMQLDRAERGFSFMKDGPLDMRMAQKGLCAADVVNRAKREDLTRIIGILGEEKKASLISRAIVKRREMQPFETTLELANLVESAIGRKAKDRIHPATRTFQALRIYVNRELEELAKAMFSAEKLLVEGGRLVIVTFHSLEDRMVKQFFADRSGEVAFSRHQPDVPNRPAIFDRPKRNAIKASKHEAHENARARSAKLRYGIRTSVTAGAENMEIFGLPNLADMELD